MSSGPKWFTVLSYLLSMKSGFLRGQKLFQAGWYGAPERGTAACHQHQAVCNLMYVHSCALTWHCAEAGNLRLH